MMLLKCCTQYASIFEKFSSGHRTGKGQFVFQSQIRAMPKSLMLKIFQARLQQYVNWEIPDVHAGFKKGRGTRDQIANICWIIEKAREFQENICFIDCTKTFHCLLGTITNCGKFLKRWEYYLTCLTCLTCLLRNLYAGQEATVRTGHGTTD